MWERERQKPYLLILNMSILCWRDRPNGLCFITVLLDYKGVGESQKDQNLDLRNIRMVPNMAISGATTRPLLLFVQFFERPSRVKTLNL